MAMKVRLGGAWRDIVGARIYSSGSWRSLKSIKVYFDGSWRDVANFTAGAGTITLTLSTSSISATRRTSNVNSGQITATPSGGQVPYTYAWVKQSGDSISATNPTSAITSFQATGMAVDETRNAVFRCTCTDTFGSSATADVSVSLTCLEPVDTGGTQ
jgi:hypothetical protein